MGARRRKTYNVTPTQRRRRLIDFQSNHYRSAVFDASRLLPPKTSFSPVTNRGAYTWALRTVTMISTNVLQRIFIAIFRLAHWSNDRKNQHYRIRRFSCYWLRAKLIELTKAVAQLGRCFERQDTPPSGSVTWIKFMYRKKSIMTITKSQHNALRLNVNNRIFF